MLNLILMTLESKDENKFSEIYNKYNKLVLSIAGNYFSNSMDREDAANTTFLKIALNINKIDNINDKSTKNFIAIICKNTCITAVNKKNKIKEISFENINEANFSTSSVEKAVDERNLIEIYKKCFSGLSDSQYEILYLKYVHNLTIKNIAKLFNIKENTAKQRIFYAKNKLNQLVREQVGDE